MLKGIGALLVILGCTAVGFGMAASHRAEEHALRQLIGALDYMACELQYRLTPLPDLCRQAGKEAKGEIGTVLSKLSCELENQISPDVESCMNAALYGCEEIHAQIRVAFILLGKSLGRFDMEGQLKGLEAVRSHCRRKLEELNTNRDSRLRSYQTLGICAGAALAILLV